MDTEVKKTVKKTKVAKKAVKAETKPVKAETKVNTSKFAIVEINSQQEKVFEGQVVEVQSLKGDSMTFDKVLAIVSEDKADFGKPYLTGAKVVAKKVEDFKGKKIVIETFRAKSRYRKKTGHRQPMTRLKIEKISA